MNAAVDTARYVDGQKLTSWAVLPGGEQICLGLVSTAGETHRIVLPVDALTGLLMTLPRMLQSALDERFPDGTLRIVHPLGDWCLEQAEGNNNLILKLGTRDGFEVAFAISDADADPLGTALLSKPREKNLTMIRRPN